MNFRNMYKNALELDNDNDNDFISSQNSTVCSVDLKINTTKRITYKTVGPYGKNKS